MSINEVLAQLPEFTFAERQLIARRVLELDDDVLSPAQLAVIDKRMADHHENPDTAIPLEEMKTRIRSRFAR